MTRRAALSSALVLMLVAPAVGAEGVGDGDRARGALVRVGVPEPGNPGAMAVAGDLGAGITESLAQEDAAHGRLAARLAAALDVARFLNVGARVSARYDRHGGGAATDEGVAFESELSARLAWRLGALAWGVETTAWLPAGLDLGSSLSAAGVDGRVLISQHASRFVLSGFAGYRLDRSGRAAPDAKDLSIGDRSALGASDFDAVLAGLGAGYHAGHTTLFAELAAQLLVGSPKFAASPTVVSVGARRPLGSGGLSGEVSIDTLISARPDLGADQALFPIEPRVMLRMGLRYRFGSDVRPPARVVTRPRPAPPVVPVPVAPTSVELALLDDRGQPLQRARVVVEQAGAEVQLVETAPGRYRLDDARPGPARLRIEAEGFKPVERDIQIGGGSSLKLDVKAEQALPAGQVRGLVRSFRGKALSAKVRVEPSGVETRTDAEGFFQLDVPPGDYEVVIESPGYAPQRRKAKVEQLGVVIVNADLVQGP